MTSTAIRIGRPPRLPLRVRRARLLNRLARYALAWGVVGAGCFWLALGDSLRAVALLAIAGFICGPRRHKTSPRTAAGSRTAWARRARRQPSVLRPLPVDDSGSTRRPPVALTGGLALPPVLPRSG